MKKFLLSLSLVLFFGLSYAADNNQLHQGKPVKYVFLFIGDGMGCNQRILPENAMGKQLLINQLPVKGMTRTESSDNKVTDSAAAGTALACGVKTKNGVLGLDAQNKQVESIAVQAQKRGMKVGILSSVPLNHATPAAFYAHVGSRGNYDDIAVMMGDSGFDFFGGSEINAKDKKKAFEYLKNKGYELIESPKDIASVKPTGKTYIYRNFGNTIDEMPASGFNLAQITAKAIETLDNPNGFFMMVEGGRIDWMCHANDGTSSIIETIELDKAVAEAYAFYQKHPDDTLIIVTADHETGGLTINDKEKNKDLLKQKESYDKIKAVMKAMGKTFVPEHHGISWQSGNHHSGAKVLTTAVGQGAGLFSGEYDNTVLSKKISSCISPISVGSNP